MTVVSESYGSMTMMVSDIHGFQEYAPQRTPVEVTSLLNNIYSTSAPLVAQYDVYKVGTIGTYVVRS